MGRRYREAVTLMIRVVKNWQQINTSNNGGMLLQIIQLL